MSSANEVFFQDWDTLVAAVNRSREEGWTVVPADRPEAGVRGFRGTMEGRDDVLLTWLPWHRVLTPKVRVCSTWREFVAELELRKLEDMEKCDDVPAFQVGFACYGRAESAGLVEVFRVGVEELQSGGAEARSKLVAMLTSSRHPGLGPLKRALASEG